MYAQHNTARPQPQLTEQAGGISKFGARKEVMQGRARATCKQH